MSSIFGWDLPPGAAGDPYAPWNESQAVCLDPYLASDVHGEVSFFWTESEGLMAQVYDNPAMYDYREVQLGVCGWRDGWTEEANCRHASRVALRRYLKKAN